MLISQFGVCFTFGVLAMSMRLETVLHDLFIARLLKNYCLAQVRFAIFGE